jgi:hypothetical protein
MLVLLAIILLATAWVAIPMLPAILIHRICPDMIIVAGKVPGTGLTLSAAGAAAIYIVVFLLLMSGLIGTATKDIASLDKPYWEITGKAHFVDGNKEVVPLDPVLKNMELKADPSNLSHNGSQVTLKIPEEVARSFPTIVIFFPDYPEWIGQLDLSKTEIPSWWKFWRHQENEMKIDPLFKQIDVPKITVKKVPGPGTYDSKTPMDRPDNLKENL